MPPSFILSQVNTSELVPEAGYQLLWSSFPASFVNFHLDFQFSGVIPHISTYFPTIADYIKYLPSQTQYGQCFKRSKYSESLKVFYSFKLNGRLKSGTSMNERQKSAFRVSLRQRFPAR